MKSARGPFQRKSRHASKGDEAREILANLILCHVPVVRFNFQAKVQTPLQPVSRGNEILLIDIGSAAREWQISR